MGTLYLSLKSIIYFLTLISSWSLHTSKENLGKQYKISDNNTYTVFRDTFSSREYNRKEVTLIIVFRLKFIGNNRLAHLLFQKLCVLDTPIWVGFAGFKRKFWMVDPKTNNYLGLYRFQGKNNAKKYADYICAVLKPVSTTDSVWYKIADTDFNSYLTKQNRY